MDYWDQAGIIEQYEEYEEDGDDILDHLVPAEQRAGQAAERPAGAAWGPPLDLGQHSDTGMLQ
jgi:hypothetical protein